MKKVPYFNLKVSVDPKVVGHSSQINGAKNIKKQDIDGFDSFVREDKFPERIPCSDSFMLHPRAKLTDMMSNKYIDIPEGFVVNARFYNLLRTFNLSNVRFYDIKILAKRDIGDFKLLYIISSPEVIDFTRSVFQEADIMEKPVGINCTFNTFDEFLQKYDEIYEKRSNWVIPKTIALHKTPDMFRLPKGNYIFISELLKSAIIESAITGVKITETQTEFMVR